MKHQQAGFTFDVYDSSGDLPEEDAALLQKARKETGNAYAPYSHFHVAAVARLKTGNYLKGTNQENASLPVGICAERVALSSVSSQFPGTVVEAVAVSYDNQNGTSNTPVSPCGMCRQTLLEYEERQLQPIRLILSGLEGAVYIIPGASLLLELHFQPKDLE